MDLERAENGLERLRALHHEIATHRWPSGGRRRSVSLRSLPVLLLSCSPQNQVSTPWISPSSRSTRASSTPTTTTATPSTLGNKYARQEFLDKVYLHLNSPFPSKFHPNRLVTLRDQVPESALFKLPMLDANGPVLGYLQKWCQDWYNYRKGEQFFLSYQKLSCRRVPGVEGVASHFHRQAPSRVLRADAFNRVSGILGPPRP